MIKQQHCHNNSIYFLKLKKIFKIIIYRNYIWVENDLGQSGKELPFTKLELLPIKLVTLRLGRNQHQRDIATNSDKHMAHFRTLRINSKEIAFEQVGIMHLPADIGISPWGNPKKRDSLVRTKMKLNYIRIYQPRNHYSDIAPVYQ